MTPYVLTADIGTSSLKCACIDFDGHPLAFSRAVFGRTVFGRAVQDRTVLAEDWEDAFSGAVRELIRGQGSLKPEAICVSGNGPTLVPVTVQGKALRPLHWHDKRSLPPRMGCSSFFLPKAVWLKVNAPLDYEKTQYFFSSHEWLMLRLGAEPVTSLPSPVYEPYYWDERQCAVFGLERTMFPPFVQKGTVIGKLSQSAAQNLGLAPAIPLVSGAPDFISAIIGSGALKPGMVCDRVGSSEGINICVSEFVEAEKMRYESEGFDGGAQLRQLPHAIDGLWNLSAVLPQSGLLFERFRGLSGNSSRDYGELLKELIPLNYDGSFNSGDWPEISEDFRGLNSTDSGRLTLETIGFSVRIALEKLKARGFPVKEMIVSGGQGKNPLWNQLKADMIGTVLLIPEIVDAELAGNAVLAALALGEVSDIEEGAAKMIRVKHKFSPREENALFWQERYAPLKRRIPSIMV